MKIASFTFNPIGVNTYLLIGNNNECVVVDCGCSSQTEMQRLQGYIQQNELTPTLALNTHAHIDHICGVNLIKEQYNIPWALHPEDNAVLQLAGVSAQMFGLPFDEIPTIEVPLHDGQSIELGGEEIKIIHTPGHSVGSVCIYIPSSQALITGDTLFKQSIGRTDLPTGDYDILMASIKEKVLTLPHTTTIFPGHGEHSTLATELSTNPFITETL